jgi:hypothetical protein
MVGVAAECGEFVETVVSLEHFRDLPDPRRLGKVTYPFDTAAVGGTGRGGKLRRHCPVWGEEVRAAAPVPAVWRRNAVA